MKKRNKYLQGFLIIVFTYIAGFSFYEAKVELWIAEEAFLGFQKENELSLDLEAYHRRKNKKWIGSSL